MMTTFWVNYPFNTSKIPMINAQIFLLKTETSLLNANTHKTSNAWKFTYYCS